MTIANTTQTAEAIRTTFAPGLVDAVFRNNELFGLTVNGQRMFTEIGNPGDTYFRWKIAKAGNSSVASYSEGDAAPTAVGQSYTNAYLAYTYLWATVEISGHLIDALQSNWFNGADAEFELTKRDLQDLATTTALTDATVGINAAVSNTITYAGIARGSAAYFEAHNLNTNGSLEIADLRDIHEFVRDNDKGGKPRFWLAPHNQVTNIGALGVTDGTTANSLVRYSGSPNDPRNVGTLPAQCYAQGLPVVGISDLTDTELYLFDDRPGNWLLVRRRDMKVDPLGKAGDADKYLITTAFAVPCLYPKLQGKISGASA